MIDTLAGTFVAAAALLLLASGAAKLRSPDTAGRLVLRLLRRPARERQRAAQVVRSIGLGELVIGSAVLITGSQPTLVLLAATYLVFAAVALVVLGSGARASCGCFGNADSPLGPAHLVLDVVACAAGIAAALRPPGPGVGLLDGNPAITFTALAQAGLLAGLGYLAVTSLPALRAARRAIAPSAPQPR